jgi:uncharacterized membrane protein
MEHYERIVPGCAARIIDQFEQQTAHRHDIEKRVVRSNVFCQKFGAISGFILGMSGMATGAFLLYIGRNGAGLTTFLSTVGTLTGVFVYGKQIQRKELEEKRG